MTIVPDVEYRTLGGPRVAVHAMTIVPDVEYRGHGDPRVATVVVWRGDRYTLACTADWGLSKALALHALEAAT